MNPLESTIAKAIVIVIVLVAVIGVVAWQFSVDQHRAEQIEQTP